MHFDQFANSFWDPQGPLRTLHDIHPARFAFIQQHLPNLQGKRILDLGCGGGLLCESLAKEGALVTGLDISEPLIETAKRHGEAFSNLHYQATSIEVFAEDASKAHSFDAICCLDMLEHVENPQAIIAQCATLLAPGGLFFASTLNRNLKSFLLAIVGAEYLLNMVPKGTHHYRDFIRPHEMADWFRSLNLQMEAISGISYHPFTRRALLDKDLSINYICVASKPSL